MGALALAVFLWPRPSESALSPGAILQTPLTRYLGQETSPSFSPDGNQIVFSWTGETNDNADIYVKVVGVASDSPRRLTTSPAHDISPAWSPNGKWIVFLRTSGPRDPTADLIRVPAVGGPETKLGEVPGFDRFYMRSRQLSWSADNKWIVMPGLDESQGSVRLMALSALHDERHWLTSPSLESWGDASPAISPSGTHLAFVRRKGFAEGHDVYVVRLSESLEVVGKPWRVTAFEQEVHSPVWISDSEIAFVGRRAGSEIGLWTVPANGSSEAQFVWPLQSPDSLAVTLKRDGTPQLACALQQRDSDIWSVNLRVGRSGVPRRLIATTSVDDKPAFSPDCAKVAFISLRSGTDELYVAKVDGSEPRQLTAFGGGILGPPSWSPDGLRIALHSRVGGQADIYLINALNGSTRKLTDDLADDALPSWSKDGKWIYFGSKRSGEIEIWRVSATGGEAQQITGQQSAALEESLRLRGRSSRPLDGAALYFADRQDHLWRQPLVNGLASGSAEHLIGGVKTSIRPLDVSEKGAYLLRKDGFLAFFDFDTRKSTPLFDLGRGAQNISVCDSQVLFDRYEWNSDLVLLGPAGN